MKKENVLYFLVMIVVVLIFTMIAIPLCCFVVSIPNVSFLPLLFLIAFLLSTGGFFLYRYLVPELFSRQKKSKKDASN